MKFMKNKKIPTWEQARKILRGGKVIINNKFAYMIFMDDPYAFVVKDKARQKPTIFYGYDAKTYIKACEFFREITAEHRLEKECPEFYILAIRLHRGIDDYVNFTARDRLNQILSSESTLPLEERLSNFLGDICHDLQEMVKRNKEEIIAMEDEDD